MECLKRAAVAALFSLRIASIVFAQDFTNADQFNNAVSFGTLDEVRAFIENGADVNEPNSYGMTPLQTASRDSGDMELFRLLLDAGARIDPPEPLYNNSPFENIIRKNDIELVQFFIDAGADIHRVSRDGMRPIDVASSVNSSPAIFNLLISSGASATAAGTDGQTPLHRAAANFNAANIRLLIGLGADVNAKENRGLTPLMFAHPSFECAGILVNAGADVNLQNDDGKTALMFAAQWGVDPRVVAFLLEAGADARIEDNTGRTALDWFDMNRRLNRHPVRRELQDRTR